MRDKLDPVLLNQEFTVKGNESTLLWAADEWNQLHISTKCHGVYISQSSGAGGEPLEPGAAPVLVNMVPGDKLYASLLDENSATGLSYYSRVATINVLVQSLPWDSGFLEKLNELLAERMNQLIIEREQRR